MSSARSTKKNPLNHFGCDELLIVWMHARSKGVHPTEEQMVICREIATRTYTGVMENGRLMSQESRNRFYNFWDEVCAVIAPHLATTATAPSAE
jgi:hypothetical protein